MIDPVLRQLAEKYGLGDPDEAVQNGDVWFYEVAPRS